MHSRRCSILYADNLKMDWPTSGDSKQFRVMREVLVAPARHLLPHDALDEPELNSTSALVYDYSFSKTPKVPTTRRSVEVANRSGRLLLNGLKDPPAFGPSSRRTAGHLHDSRIHCRALPQSSLLTRKKLAPLPVLHPKLQLT